jgi:hypothetical protein
MKQAVEMAPGAMIYIPIDSGIQVVLGLKRQLSTDYTALYPRK